MLLRQLSLFLVSHRFRISHPASSNNWHISAKDCQDWIILRDLQTLSRISWQVQHKINIVGIEQRPCSDNIALYPRWVVKEEAATLIKAMPQEQEEVLVVDITKAERSNQMSLQTIATMHLVKRKWQNRDLHPSNPERCTVLPAINWKIILCCRCNGNMIMDWTQPIHSDN